MKQPRRQRAVLSRSQFTRRLGIELLEDRRLLAVGDLLQTLVNPNTQPQVRSEFGRAVAVDGPYTVVGTPSADLAGASDVGCVHVFNTSTGALVATLNNPVSDDISQFGCSVAVSGGIIVVGACESNTGALRSGSAYVFDATSGNLVWTLNNPTPEYYELFGYSVAISGSTIVVGTNSNANGVGSAYVFDATTGSLLRTLSNPTSSSGDQFGRSVAVSGSTIVVGSCGDDTGASDAGSAYVFDATSGDLLWTLDNPTPMAQDRFGCAVAVSGSTIVVGAYMDGSGEIIPTGASAYVFNAANGKLSCSLKSPTSSMNDRFGWSVAVSGGTIVVGEYASCTNGAYAFDATSGNLLWTLNDPTPESHGYFGYCVTVSGSTIVVGEHAGDMGAAYVFDATSGNLLWPLNDPNPTACDCFGSSVALSGGTMVVGVPGFEQLASDFGSAYLFDATSGNLLRPLNNPSMSSWGDSFGCAVAASDDTIVVGASRRNMAQPGSAYIFDAASGNLLWTLNSPNPNANDWFGCAVAVSGGTIVVGAAGYGTGTTGGSAYVFDAATGNLLWTLNDPTPSYLGFGCSVAISGSTIVVGAYLNDAGTGAAYVFDAASGNFLWKLSNPTPQTYGDFGYSVAVSGSTIVVGAPTRYGSGFGSAYVFDATNGSLLRTLNRPFPVGNDWFGDSVAVSGSTIVVGAQYGRTNGCAAGTSYVFDAASAEPLATLNNPTPNQDDYFGCAVAVSDGKALIGAFGVDDTTTSRGEAHLFDVNAVSVPPVLSGIEAAPLGYLPKQAATQITSTLAAGDMDSPMLVGATVEITAGYQNGQDLLLFANTTTIAGTWNAATGTLTLAGVDTVANYQAALQSIKYQNGIAKPSQSTRTIGFMVSDGQADSNLVTRDVVFNPPVLSGIETKAATYREKRPALAVSTNIKLKDGNSPRVAGATVQITAGYQANQDVLSFVNTKTITGTWDQVTGTLTLAGSDTVANYQKALRAVKYRNTSVNPIVTARTVSFQASDGLVVSNTLARDVNVKAVNDPPVLSGIETTSLGYVAGSPAAVVTSSTVITDVDSSMLTGATIKIVTGYKKGQDVLVFDGLGAITGTWNAARGILTLKGSDTPAAYEAALRAVKFQNMATSPTFGTRKISFTVIDGLAMSKAITRAIVVARANPTTAVAIPGLKSAIASLRPTQSMQTARQSLFASVRNWAVDPSC